MASNRYLQVVFTVIAAALLIIALNPWIAPREVAAQNQNPVPVYIVDGPFGLYTWAKVAGNGSLQVRIP